MLMPGTPRYFHKRKYTENLNTHCILKFVIIISKILIFAALNTFDHGRL